MLDDELLDVLSTAGQGAAGGYCTSLGDYHVPFIFANFNGTQHDVEVVTHEAGHAFAAYMNRERIPYVLPSGPAWRPARCIRCPWSSWPGPGPRASLAKDTRKFRYSHLAGRADLHPLRHDGGSLPAHRLRKAEYDPGPAPRGLEGAGRASTMPWMRLDGEIPFYGAGEYWQRQMHIYQSPFYYIDYCLAQTVSLQIWALMQKDRANAWDHYMAYTRQGGSRVFTELLKNADLVSPFEESCLRGVCETAKDWLDHYDLTGLE